MTPLIMGVSLIAAWAQIVQPKKINVDFNKEKITIDNVDVSFNSVVFFNAIKANGSKYYLLGLGAKSLKPWRSFLYVLAYSTNSNDDEITAAMQKLKLVIEGNRSIVKT